MPIPSLPKKPEVTAGGFVAILSCVAFVACSSDNHTNSTPGGPDARADASQAPADASEEPATTSHPPPPPPKEAAVEAAPPEASIPDSGDAGPPYPPLLSETGLFEDIGKGTLADGVREYQPQYPLWSDGATKRRWMYFPAGTKIDTSDMNFWVFPQGTKLFKEFSVGGKRVETRMLNKAGPTSDDWVMIAYAWKDDLSDAVAVPAGVENAAGTTHDIPALGDCQFCHGNMKDRLLGVGAIQLSHDLSGVKLTDLIQEGMLTKPPAGNFKLPGGPVASDALGYLHGNCGDCHNAQSGIIAAVNMQLWENTSSLGSVKATTAYRTAVNLPDPEAVTNRIVPGDPDDSEVFVRMGLRGSGQMPPVCTKEVDPTGLATVRAFIESLGPKDGGVDGGKDSGP